MGSAYVDLAIYVALIVLGLTFLWLEAAVLGRHRGVRRWIALVAAAVVAWIISDVVLDPAVHPLWPIEIVLWLIPAILILAVLHASAKPRMTAG